jgi:hypothetical protein
LYPVPPHRVPKVHHPPPFVLSLKLIARYAAGERNERSA